MVKKRYWCTKHVYIVFDCIAYIFNREVDASQANLLKNAKIILARRDGNFPTRCLVGILMDSG